jgi:polygalacturonase
MAVSGLIALHARAAAPFDVKSYGAVGDGTQTETAAINTAIDACAKSGGGVVFFPAGRYLSGTIVLKSHVAIEISAGATLLASQSPADYPDVIDVWAQGRKAMAPFIYADDAENITITGRGTIDGQGESWWRPILQAKARRAKGATQPTSQPAIEDNGPRGRPQLIRLVNCKDVVIEKINVRNSPSWNIHPLLCENVRVDGVTITATVPSPNTDGINPESCRNVQIINCRIDVGDDCVTLKSGINELGRAMGRPDEDITVSNCVMYQGHGGVTIGSEMSGGVRNVTVSNCVFQGTDNGIRIKSQRGRGGIVEELSVSNIVMQDVPHPFVVTTFYMGKDKPSDVYEVDEGTPRFRDFLFSNITARGAKDAGSITGLKEMPVENMTFDNVHVQAERGFTCTNAKEIVFQDVVIDTTSGPALLLKDCGTIDTARLKSRVPHDGTSLVETAK